MQVHRVWTLYLGEKKKTHSVWRGFFHKMQNDGDVDTIGKDLIQGILARHRGCAAVWERLEVHPYKVDDTSFQSSCLTHVTLDNNKLVFSYGRQHVPFTSLKHHFQEVVDQKANVGNNTIPDTDYDITENSLKIYHYLIDLNPTRIPEILRILKLWQKALRDCFLYLENIEATLHNIRAFEKEIMTSLKIEMPENHHVKEITLIPKEADVVKVMEKTRNIEEIRQIVSHVSECYDIQHVSYVPKAKICGSRDQVVKEIKKGKDILLADHMTALDLFNDYIGERGALIVASGLHQPNNITTLDLRVNKLGRKGIHYIAALLKKNQTITTLRLGNNSLGVAGAQCMASALKGNHTLENLDLAQNELGDEGVLFISLALKENNTLKTISLSGNDISWKGTQYLGSMLAENKSLTSLDLGRNRIGSDGVQWITKVLKENNTLTSLDVQRNRIGDEGAAFFVSLLEENDFLNALHLQGNFIGPAGAYLLVSVLKKKPHFDHA
eukprot:TRINITY_DN937_c0_g1_i7.p1 TRINITY_DN937_c0_g1~~TRINITY_DN937_c0_g1_i7.p1  ORF type:complete len:497 (+),score=61.29 TRINITY_DN937_c0_g1_i7:706-2196(+)